MTEFKKFRVGDLFEVVGSNVFKTDYCGKVDVIKAQSSNNGIASTIEGPANLLNGITIGMRGSFNAFVHVEPFIIGDNVAGFWFKGDSLLSINSMLYIATCLNKIYAGFSGYENYPTFYKLTNDLIQLPVSGDGSPDWQQMESVVETVEQHHVETVDKTLSAAGFSSFEDTLLTSEEESLLKEWLVAQTKSERSASAPVPSALRLRMFKISELFEVCLSNGDNKINLLPSGDTPLVSSGNSNNGIVGYVDSDTYLFSNNNITVDMFGNAFYQSTDFYAVSHGRVNILKLKENKYSSENILLYLVTAINKITQNNAYGFSNMLSSNVVRSLDINLPVFNTDDQPSFEIMNQMGFIFKKLAMHDLRRSLDDVLIKYKNTTTLNA